MGTMKAPRQVRTVKPARPPKGIKVLDKSIDVSRRMKNAFVQTKQRAEETQDTGKASPSAYANDNVSAKTQTVVRETIHGVPDALRKAHDNFARAKNHFREVKRQLPKERRRAAEQAKEVAVKTKDSAENLRKTAEQAKNMAAKTKAAVKGSKQTLRAVKQSGRQTLREARQAEQQIVNKITPPKGASNTGGKAAESTMETVTQSSRTAVKSANTTKRSAKQTAKGTIKTAKKTVKTAERTAKQAVKTAQVTAETAKMAEKTARAAAKTAVQTAKAATRAVISLVKATIAAAKGLVTLIAAGGWIAVFIILVVCMIGLFVGSVFGIFFSNEPNPNTGQTVNTVIAEINTEYTAQIDSIIATNTYNLLDMSGARAAWKEVLAVYTVKTVSDPANPMDVATMDAAKASILRTVFADMHSISHSVEELEIEIDLLDADGVPTGETTTVTKTVLRIVVSRKTPDEMAVQYGFSSEQKEWLTELLKPDYHQMWNALLYGVSGVGDMTMIAVAETQIGNVGGEPYWSWYGFASRVEWCACFVSWCAEQCGYIDAGILPRFSSCQSQGIPWFQARGQWQERDYTPKAGDIIFFDWEGDGHSDHVGIVERVEGEYVHTIEGNTSDSVARRSYRLDSVNITGYGIPAYTN